MPLVPRHFALIFPLALAACDAPPPTSAPPANPPPLRNDARPAAGNDSRAEIGNARNFKQRQMEFLNRIRQSDPQQTTIDRAMLNEENELGLILDHRVDLDKIPALMRTMLAQMAKEFPGQDLTVIAYTPSNPPHKIGTAQLNARTRDMTYTPAR